MTSTLYVLRVSDKTNVVDRQDVRMTSTGTYIFIETWLYHLMAGHLSDLLKSHVSASTS